VTGATGAEGKEGKEGATGATGATGGLTVGTYTASEARVQGKEFEPSKTEAMQVILTVTCKALTECKAVVKVGAKAKEGTTVAEGSQSSAQSAATKMAITFVVPAKQSWEVPTNAGITEMKSVYLPL
jgi:hypothetical protein